MIETTAKTIEIKPLGVHFHQLTLAELCGFIDRTITNKEKQIIANHNLHSLYTYQHDERMRAFYAKSARIVIDGMPLIWLGKMFGYPLQRENRMTHLDWIPPLLTLASEKGWRVFYLGSAPGVAELGAQEWRSRHAGLQIRTMHGYFDVKHDSPENRQLITEINSYRPQILMVGMGMPRQEGWIVENLPELNANIILNVGALIDYSAGAIPTPPRWLGSLGLEWLYRLAAEPKRLGRRYLMEPWFLLWTMLVYYLKRAPAQ